MAYAEGKGAPPEELSVWDNWQFFNLPPEAGGLNDQPAGLLQRIRIVLDVISAWRDYRTNGTRAGEMAAWRDAHPREFKIVRWVKDMIKNE